LTGFELHRTLPPMDQRKESERWYVDELFRRLRLKPHAFEIGERPDFTFVQNGKQIGLEVTCAVYQELARAVKMQIEERSGEGMVISSLKDGARRRSNREIAADAFSLSDEPASQSCDDEMREWAEKIALALEAKRERLNRPGFRLFHENWLLIYDHPGLGNDGLTYREAPEAVSRLFAARSAHRSEFEAVFIVSGRYLFRGRAGQVSWRYAAGSR
jgi:hypothetical protein